MSAKAILVIAVLGASGELSQPPVVLPQDDLAACNASAKATVEALALTLAERLLPGHVTGSPVLAVQQPVTGIWMPRYKRQARDGEAKEAEVTIRQIRATCRPIG